MSKRINKDFYTKDALFVAPNLLGKVLVRKLESGEELRYRITETEAYIGEEDTACHARFGKTKRNAIIYEQGGYAYVYMCYGIHYLLNVVTEKKDKPQAVLIRGVEGYNGPGKLTKKMEISKELDGENLMLSEKLWIEDDGYKAKYYTTPRIGIDYATEPYKSIGWRFVIEN